MKTLITIDFKKINKIEVNETLLKNIPMLKKTTEKTVKILCEQIEKYFKDKNIEVETKFEMK